ncbi:MAG: Gfo/Idh/MocA family oxidoreductase [Planctomycetes bacterium]|nr:Gfo/Idh/MocA family oxidoreductase [Planctomycetota bacterium]
MSNINRNHSDHSRRDFIKNTSALLAGGALLGTQARVAMSANISGSDEVKVAVIGAGGRGTGAAVQALETAGPVTLWAIADAFEDQVEGCLRNCTQFVEKGRQEGNPLLKDSKVDVPKERQFVGFNAYQQAIDSGADLVILATPPGFRPIHFEAAVKAGKHVFTEKPVAVDAPGVRRFLAANEEAKEKNLMVAVGLQRHHDPRYQETIQRLQDGAIGDILYTRVYWNSGGLWVRPRQPSQTEMEYQMRNWYYFNWLCGDHIVEQHIHNLDVSNWLRGMHPAEAQGMGGRQVRTGKEYGQIFDHHFVEFTYPDGTKMFSQCRHIDGCFNEVDEFAHGMKGTADIGQGRIEGADGKWRCSAKPVDAHHQEHHDLFAALRRGEVYNEGDNGAIATMTSILGRMATYSGKVVKWDEALQSTVDLSPAEYDFAAAPPVVPDANGFYPVAVPGKTEVLQVAKTS